MTPAWLHTGALVAARAYCAVPRLGGHGRLAGVTTSFMQVLATLQRPGTVILRL